MNANEGFLFIINPEKLDQKKTTSLKYNDEIIDLQISASIFPGSQVTFGS